MTQFQYKTRVVEETNGMRQRFLMIALLIVALVAVNAASAQTPEVPREETLIIGWEGSGEIASPQNFNPYANGAPNFNNGTQMMIESLFYLNYETGEMIPWLATGYEYSEDFMQVDISLREGVMWSDGEAFTADDVAFTINLLKDENFSVSASFTPSMRQWVDTVEAVDPLTVRVSFVSPNPRFLLDYFSVHIYDMVVILPEHIWSQAEDPTAFTNYDPAAGLPVFTGPYRVASAAPLEIAYDRRDDWWAAETGFHALPAPRRVIYTAMGALDVAATRFQNNELDAGHRIPANLFESVRAVNPNVGSWQAEAPYGWTDPCPRTFWINTAVEPWTNPNLRRALSLSLDRSAIAAAEFGLEPGGAATPFTFPAYAELSGYYEENADLFEQYSATAYDPEMAAALIEAEGYVRGDDGFFERDGENLSIEIVGDSGWAVGQPVYQLMELYLDNAGIDATTTLVAGAVVTERRDIGDFNLAVRSPCGSVVDPYRSLDLWHGRNVRPIPELVVPNSSRWNNEAYNALVDQIGALEPGDPAIRPLVREALTIWLENQPALPLYQQARVVPHNTTYWTNWPTAENNYIHPVTWWGTTLMQVIELQPAQ
jgi:peptide/nickel transport system substrate-binding protein